MASEIRVTAACLSGSHTLCWSHRGNGETCECSCHTTTPDRSAPEDLVEALAGAVADLFLRRGQFPPRRDLAEALAPTVARLMAQAAEEAVADLRAEHVRETAGLVDEGIRQKRRANDMRAERDALAERLAGVEALIERWAEEIQRGHEANPDGHAALSGHERDLEELLAALHPKETDRG